jgi:hypothetical protein
MAVEVLLLLAVEALILMRAEVALLTAYKLEVSCILFPTYFVTNEKVTK